MLRRSELASTENSEHLRVLPYSSMMIVDLVAARHPELTVSLGAAATNLEPNGGRRIHFQLIASQRTHADAGGVRTHRRNGLFRL